MIMDELFGLTRTETDAKIGELRAALNDCVSANFSLCGREALKISQELDRYIVLSLAAV